VDVHWFFGVKGRIAWRRLFGSKSFRMNDHTKLATWISLEDKARFLRLADRDGLTDSAMHKVLINDLVAATEGPHASKYPRLNGALGRPKGGRLTFRLHNADRLLLKKRADARGLREATYLAMLVRSHVRSLKPLPSRDLRALQLSIAELSAIGRNLNQIARTVNEGRSTDRTLRTATVTLIPACAKLRDHVTALIKSDLISWESVHDQTRRQKTPGIRARPRLDIVSFGKRGAILALRRARGCRH
jgi:hypothetical protein